MTTMTKQELEISNRIAMLVHAYLEGDYAVVQKLLDLQQREAVAAHDFEKADDLDEQGVV